MNSKLKKRMVLTIFFASLSILLASSLRAQSSPDKSQSRVQVKTQLVEFDVLVHDSHGQPITGLLQKDFTITDDGQAMPISSFTILSRSTQASRGQLAASSQQGADLFTNTPVAHPNVPANLTIILVDALNTPYQDMIYSNQQLIRYLSQLKPEDHVAIYTLGSKFAILHDFTSDDADLVEAVKGYVSSNAATPDAKEFLKQIRATASPGSPNAAVVAEIENNMSNIDDPISPEKRNTSVSTTLAALRQIALHVSGVPGRKNLLWLSVGFPLELGINGMSTAALSGGELYGNSGSADPGLSVPAYSFPMPAVYLEQLQETLRQLESANVAIYPVDARGLVAETAAADPRFANTSTGGPEGTAGASIGEMEAIADRTGGIAFYNTNAATTSLQTVQNDAQDSYLIGYYPQTQWDGKFHRVDIKVSQSGTHVRARRGYFATAPPKSPDEERKLALGTAANSLLDSTEIPFTVKLSRTGASSGGTPPSYSALMYISGSAIHFTQDGDRWDGQLEFVVVQRDSAGNIASSSGTKMSWAIPAARYQEALNALLTNTVKFTLAPGATTVRFIVRDAAAAALGTVSVPTDKLPAASGSN